LSLDDSSKILKEIIKKEKELLEGFEKMLNEKI